MVGALKEEQAAEASTLNMILLPNLWPFSGENAV